MTSLCKILWPLDIEGLNIQLWEDTGGGMLQVGTYNPHDPINTGYYMDMGDVSTGYGNLLDELALLFTTSGTNDYEFQASDTSFGRADFKLSLVRTSGTADFELRTSDTSGTILEMLGAEDASDLPDTSGAISFANPYKGSWLLPKPWQYHDYRKYPKMVAGVSTTANNSVFVRVRNKSDFRHLSFLAVPGVLAYADRTTFQRLVDQVPGVEFGDQHISFETFWDECISVGGQIRFYHGVDSDEILQTLAGKSEMVVDTRDLLESPSDFVTEKYKEHGVDYVDIEFNATVKADRPPLLAPVVINNLINEQLDNLVNDDGDNIIEG